MAVEIIEDNGGLLIRVRNADGSEYWVRRSRVQHIGGGVYETCTETRAQELRAAYARAEERKRKKMVEEANREAANAADELEGELAMQGPSRTLRTSTSGGR
jgi:hypothetical protein